MKHKLKEASNSYDKSAIDFLNNLMEAFDNANFDIEKSADGFKLFSGKKVLDFDLIGKSLSNAINECLNDMGKSPGAANESKNSMKLLENYNRFFGVESPINKKLKKGK